MCQALDGGKIYPSILSEIIDVFMNIFSTLNSQLLKVLETWGKMHLSVIFRGCTCARLFLLLPAWYEIMEILLFHHHDDDAQH